MKKLFLIGILIFSTIFSFSQDVDREKVNARKAIGLDLVTGTEGDIIRSNGDSTLSFNDLDSLIDIRLAALGIDLWYGVQWDVTSASTILTKIGNTDYKTTLPVHAAMQAGVIKNDKSITYYLDETDFTKKADGSVSDLTGTDGQAMIIIPKHYRKFEEDGNIRRAKISMYPLTGFDTIAKCAVGIYEGYVKTSDTLCSVTGQTATTSKTRANFRTYAAKRGTGWSQLTYDAYSTIYWLYLIEYADWNNQDSLGVGATNANGTNWGEYNGYNPVVSSGLVDSYGMVTNSVAFSVDNWYKGTADGTKVDTLVDSGRFSVWDGTYVGKYVVNTVTGDSAQIVSKVSNDELELSADKFTSGQGYYISGSTLNSQAVCYRGWEHIFGHIFKLVDGININEHVVYTCSVLANFADATTTNYTLTGTATSSNGYITRFLNETIIPSAVGGSSSTYMCDYYYQSTGWRVAAWGGLLDYGTHAGLGSAYFDYSAGAVANVGSRLCLKF